MNSPVILHKICPECKAEFQTYDTSKECCSRGCNEVYHRVRYVKFLKDRKAKREQKDPKLCRKQISCINCNHYLKNCKGR